ncbi:hypothetical protein SK128_019242 [Halocaridina rubra]|uniref:Uncharacterized protein n=1 Tax=Halocaridina rubra TaxID=373956 RepID=A0AAN9AA57_HALRR
MRAYGRPLEELENIGSTWDTFEHIGKDLGTLVSYENSVDTLVRIWERLEDNMRIFEGFRCIGSILEDLELINDGGCRRSDDNRQRKPGEQFHICVKIAKAMCAVPYFSTVLSFPNKDVRWILLKEIFLLLHTYTEAMRCL